MLRFDFSTGSPGAIERTAVTILVRRSPNNSSIEKNAPMGTSSTANSLNISSYRLSSNDKTSPYLNGLLATMIKICPSFGVGTERSCADLLYSMADAAAARNATAAKPRITRREIAIIDSGSIGRDSFLPTMPTGPLHWLCGRSRGQVSDANHRRKCGDNPARPGEAGAPCARQVARIHTIAGTTWSGGRWPSAKVLMLMMTFSPISSLPSSVADAMCGSRTTFCRPCSRGLMPEWSS